MDQVRRAFARIAAQLGKLETTHQLLIGSLAVIALMGLFLATRYAATPSKIPLLEADPQMEMVRVLRASDIAAEVRDGQVYVPPQSRRLALASLAQTGSLPDDTRILFGNLLENQKWTNSREQNQQLYQIALQNELSAVIAEMPGIRSARVLIDVPEAQGLGLVVREPTASATVATEGGRSLSQSQVDAIAHLISGAQSGLDVASVRVIANGRRHIASGDDQLLATTYLEHAAAVEKRLRQKLMDLFGYIPGVIVEVTAHVDVAREDVQMTSYLPESEGSVQMLSRERVESTSQSDHAGGGEPGLRSNVAASVNAGSRGPATRSEKSESEAEFENRFGSQVTRRHDPKGMPTRLVASIRVPKAFVIEAAKLDVGGEDHPGEEAVERAWEALRRGIESDVRPHLQTEKAPGEVSVSMIPVAMPMGEMPQQAGVLGGVGEVIREGGGMVQSIALVALAAASVGLMLMMVRRAGRTPQMPGAQELVGIPPPLSAPEDLLGDVSEGDEAIMGLEINEGDVEKAKMLEQITEMIRQSPEASASQLKRWINPDD